MKKYRESTARVPIIILQRYSLGETNFEVPRTNFTYREVEEKVPRKYRKYRENTASTAKSRYFRGSRYAVLFQWTISIDIVYCPHQYDTDHHVSDYQLP